MKKQDEHIAQLQKQIEEWKAKYLRALADYQNVEKRKHEEVAQVRRYAGEHILTGLLPIVDTLEKAKEHLNDPGLALVVKELTAFLDAQDVKKIDPLGKTFNPHEMECIEAVEGEHNMVTDVVRPGYMIHDKIVQVAQVKVGRRNEESTNAQSANEKKIDDTS